MRIETKSALLAAATSVCVLVLTFSLAFLLRSSLAAEANRKAQANTNPVQLTVNLNGQAVQGHSLFERNCALCHGDDARGDEGPTLYNLAMSDVRIAKRIKEGVKGQMPKFGSKLTDVDVKALIAYLRTLRD